jgi:tetratricopeptide (TPR) repeat protein
LVAVPLAFGLMSKPMLVTFPFLFLLLDIWPLHRAQFPKVLWEKLPLIALSAADAVVTYLVQHSTGAVQAIPFLFRLRNALVAYIIYIGQLFWPTRLAVFYPIHAVAVWQAALACLFLLAVSALAVYWWRPRPWFATGWFWFLGTLVPVIGLVQVGGQAHADRYTYIPLVGLSIILAWGAQEIRQVKPAAWIAGAIAFCIVCMALTAQQTSYWENDGTLFQHALDVTENNFTAQNGLALYLAKHNRTAEAIPHFEEYLRLVPSDAKIHNNLGILYGALPGREKDAIAQFEAGVRLEPDFKEAQYNLGMALSKIPGRTADAIAHLDAARRIQPSATINEMIDRLRSTQ